MAYTNNDGVDESIPVGSTTPGATIDTKIQDVKKAYNERLDAIFGTDWENDDPLLPIKVGPTIVISGGQVYTAIYDAGNSGTAKTIDWNNGDQQKVTMTGNCIFTFSNVKVGAAYTLWFVQDGTGGRSITLPVACKQGTTAFATTFFTTTVGTLSGISLAIYNSATFVVGVLTTGSSVS